MSKLNELIRELCPDGVEYKKLGEVCILSAGGDAPKTHMSKIKSDEYKYPIYSNGVGDNALYGYTDEYKISSPCVTVAARGTIGWAALRTEPFYPIVRLICLLPNNYNELNVSFLKYVIDIMKFPVPEGSIPQLTIPMLKNREIPLPPLPVQSEVVRILDSFTKLKAELEAELAGRIEQYEYYRDHMLDKKNLERMDGKPVEMKKLGEVCNYVKNKVDIADILPENYTSVENLIKNCGGRMNAISVPKDGKCTDVMIGDILLGNIRPNLRKAWLATCAGGASNDVLVIRIKDGVNLNARYLYQIIAGNDFSCYNISHMRGAKMPRGDKSKILNYELPVPSLATQERIVDILDRFDTLTTSPTDGIPAEIAMRREQYEYWRSRILDFHRLPDDVVSDGE